MTTVQSPCIGKCKLVDSICVGCSRTGDEIANWLYMTEEEKQTIINRLKEVS